MPRWTSLLHADGGLVSTWPRFDTPCVAKVLLTVTTTSPTLPSAANSLTGQTEGPSSQACSTEHLPSHVPRQSELAQTLRRRPLWPLWLVPNLTHQGFSQA